MTFFLRCPKTSVGAIPCGGPWSVRSHFSLIFPQEMGDRWGRPYAFVSTNRNCMSQQGTKMPCILFLLSPAKTDLIVFSVILFCIINSSAFADNIYLYLTGIFKLIFNALCYLVRHNYHLVISNNLRFNYNTNLTSCLNCK